MKKSVRITIILTILMLLFGSMPIKSAHAATTWIVINTNDSGAGSLRHAIENSTSGDTITFDPSLSGQTVITAGLNIEHDLTIDGTTLPEHVKISGNNLSTVISAPKCSIQEGCSTATVTINDLDIINGGIGGIRNFMSGTMHIDRVNFYDNHNSGYFGGAISNNGNMTISASTFTNNSGDRGGAIFNSGTMSINQTTIANNTSDNWGGGIYNENIITISQSSIYSNDAGWSGDGVFTRMGTNIASAAISDSVIYNNDGHGIFFEGSFTTGDVNDKLTITNSTISGNTGKGVVNTYGSMIIKHSTITNNSQPIEWGGGSGVYSFGDDSRPGTIIITNSIIANNINGKDCTLENTQIIESTGNLIENSGDGINNCGTVAITSDPLLGSLSNNGGPTQTIALQPGSPAIDTGDDDACISTDQRGVTRPQGSHCDIGAFELEGVYPMASEVTAPKARPNLTTTVDFVVKLSETVFGVEILDFQLLSPGLSNAAITGVSGSGDTYTVSVYTGTGKGTLQVNLLDNDSIVNSSSIPLGGTGANNGNFLAGEIYPVVIRSSTGAPKEVDPSFKEKEPLAFEENNHSLEVAPIAVDNNGTSSEPETSQLAVSDSNGSTGNALTLSAPKRRSPVDKAILSKAPTFYWTKVIGGLVYQFEYDNNADFSSPTFTVNANKAYYLPPRMKKGTYYWHVKVRDTTGSWSQWSPTYTVTITSPNGNFNLAKRE